MDCNRAPKVLRDVAEAAQDVAAGFNKFLGPVPESKADLTALIAKCFEVSSSLHNLAKAVEDTRGLATYARISDDVRDVAYSLNYTFKDVRQIVGEGLAGAKNVKLSLSTPYRRVWRSIIDYFQRESGNMLIQRLEYCRRLLLDLADILHEGYEKNNQKISNSFSRVR